MKTLLLILLALVGMAAGAQVQAGGHIITLDVDGILTTTSDSVENLDGSITETTMFNWRNGTDRVTLFVLSPKETDAEEIIKSTDEFAEYSLESLRETYTVEVEFQDTAIRTIAGQSAYIRADTIKTINDEDLKMFSAGFQVGEDSVVMLNMAMSTEVAYKTLNSMTVKKI